MHFTTIKFFLKNKVVASILLVPSASFPLARWLRWSQVPRELPVEMWQVTDALCPAAREKLNLANNHASELGSGSTLVDRHLTAATKLGGVVFVTWQ